MGYTHRASVLPLVHPVRAGLIRAFLHQSRSARYVGVKMGAMNNPKPFVAIALVLACLGSACTEGNKDQARKAAQDIEDKTKEIAEDAAEKTKEVVADVAEKGKEIVSATGEVITDGWITTKVKAKFADDKLLKDSGITIETRERVVTLKGTVPTTQAKRQAAMIAGGTEGVLKVVDQIVVKAK